MSGETGPWWTSEELDRDHWGGIVEPVLERFTAARDRDRLPHALLVVGPPGLGRELAAVEMAVLLVCPDAAGPWSTGRCADRIRRGVHPDVVAMRPEGRTQLIRIKPLRDELIDVVSGRPYEGERRVWIFDGVEARHFPKASANAALKTLEEPPEHAVFILLAANPDGVLPTIRSRCQQLVLPGVVAVARQLQSAHGAPELAAESLAGLDVEAGLGVVRRALTAAMGGESGELLRLPYGLADGVPPFAVVAAGALEMAVERETEAAGEDLARLAAELLAVERRSRALNLGTDVQLTSCLMRWYREL
jgi:DNA polymerase-3 subunit delta'